MFGSKRARFVGSILASGALVIGCGSTRSDDPTLGTGGAAGATASAGNAAGGSASTGQSGAPAKAGAGGSPTVQAGASGNSAGSGGVVASVPGDSRPPRPTWVPPFTIGAPGWRESTEELCEKSVGDQQAFDVWADSRGVFGIFATTCNVLGGTSCGKQGVSLQFNDGTGWKLVYAVPPGPGMGGGGDMRLSGFASGPLLLTGFLPDQLGIWRITQAGEVAFDAPLEVARPVTVGADTAYAFSLDKFYRFADDKWAEYLTLPAPAQGLWADEDRVLLVGGNQAVFQKNTADADFAAIPGVPAGDYTAVWSFAANDTWVGNQAGQLVHYDGSKWTVFETGSKDITGAGIVQLWGSSDGQLFFRTYTEFGRYDGKQVELLLELPADGDPSLARVITGGLWGLSSKEVFLSVTDKQFNKYACGGQFMLFFDGTTLHPF